MSLSKAYFDGKIYDLLEPLEFSEGLKALRDYTGKQLSFMNLITNYEVLKEAKKTHDAEVIEKEKKKRQLDKQV